MAKLHHLSMSAGISQLMWRNQHQRKLMSASENINVAASANDVMTSEKLQLSMAVSAA